MSNLYLHHNAGLGDHFICNAIVRHYALIYDRVFLFVKPHNLETVSFLYRDLPQIKFLVIPANADWTEEMAFVYSFKRFNSKDTHIEIGFNPYKGNFDLNFYNQSGLDFNDRFDKFYVKRDMDREMWLFNHLNLKEEHYILSAPFASNGRCYFNIPLYTQHPNLRIVLLEPITSNLFDWIYTAQHAREIFANESAFRLMIDNWELNQPLFFKRKNDMLPIMKNYWREI